MHNHFLLTPYVLDQAATSLQSLVGPGWQVNGGDPSGSDQVSRMGSIHRRLCGLVEGVLGRGDRVVSVAGDCCAAIPVLAGLQHTGLHPVILWLDAHGDFNTAGTTVTGFLGGMPLAMMSGRGEQVLMQAVGAHPILDADIVLADARDLDPAERVLLQGSGVRLLHSTTDVVDALPARRPLYVHLDFDILRPADAPAMRYSVAGGPSVAELQTLGTVLHATGRVVAVSATTWDFDADQDGRTGRACLQVLHAFLGLS